MPMAATWPPRAHRVLDRAHPTFSVAPAQYRYLLGRRLPLTPAFPSAARPLTARDPMRCAYHCLRPSRSLHETRLQARSVRRAFEHVERRDTRVDEVVVGRADRERKGRSDRNGAAGNGRAVHVGSKEDVGGLSPPTDAVYGLAGLYVPASASHYGACIRARPQPASCGVARQNRGCRVCGKSGVTSTHENPRPGMPHGLPRNVPKSDEPHGGSDNRQRGTLSLENRNSADVHRFYWNS